LQCLKRLADDARTDEKLVVSLWRHEMERIVKDRICRFADQKWFDDTLDDTIKEVGRMKFCCDCSFYSYRNRSYFAELQTKLSEK
jgi:hypothetical protein